jgi:hypothetical protein
MAHLLIQARLLLVLSPSWWAQHTWSRVGAQPNALGVARSTMPLQQHDVQQPLIVRTGAALQEDGEQKMVGLVAAPAGCVARNHCYLMHKVVNDCVNTGPSVEGRTDGAGAAGILARTQATKRANPPTLKYAVRTSPAMPCTNMVACVGRNGWGDCG